MRARNWVLISCLACCVVTSSTYAGAEIMVGAVYGPPRPRYHLHHYHPYPVYPRPVYVRRVYPQTVVREVYVERPVYVERQVVVEQPSVAPAPATTVKPTIQQAQQLQPVLPDPNPPKNTTNAKPAPAPEPLQLVPTTPQPAPTTATVTEVVTPLPDYVKFEGVMPEGPTTEYKVVHPKTGCECMIPIPACGLKEIDPGKWEVELEYENGEIEIEFKRDGHIKVKYEFDEKDD
ncbi:MAG: hypothetical protein U1D30_07585 [Planctomycetota bacterium]